jgi:hypothetical protein
MHTAAAAAVAAVQSFLADNGLRLIIRSHEGPDARDKRLEGDRMPSVDSGYAVDHDTPSEYVSVLFNTYLKPGIVHVECLNAERVKCHSALQTFFVWPQE